MIIGIVIRCYVIVISIFGIQLKNPEPWYSVICSLIPSELADILLHQPVSFLIAVPLSNQDEPDSYCIDAHVLLVNRLRHVFEQADSSSRTERSGDPGSRGFNDLLDTG